VKIKPDKAAAYTNIGVVYMKAASSTKRAANAESAGDRSG
jgi:hypothetical protein